MRSLYCRAATTAALLLAPSFLTAQSANATAITQVSRMERGALRIDVLVDEARAGAGVEVAEITFQPGSGGGEHTHGSTELLYVLQGLLDHTVNGVTTRLSPGMLGIAKAGDRVRHGVASTTPVKVLVVWTPSGEAGRLAQAFGVGTRMDIRTLAQEMEGLTKLRDEWSAAYNAGSIEPMRDMYTQNAVRMPYDALVQTGRDSVVSGYERSFANRTMTPLIRLEAAQVEIRGDIAIERGTYHEVLTPRAANARVLVERGKYVSLARRGEDGKWRFEWSIFNRDAQARPQ